MITFIQGNYVTRTQNAVVIEAHGVGYEILVPSGIQRNLPQEGASLKLHTAYIVRELSQTLYGFQTVKDRDFFNLLLTVTGIGPKIALAVLGSLSLEDFIRAIHEQNLAVISKVPGIGKRSAERLVIELKDKLATYFPRDHDEQTLESQAGSPSFLQLDAINALINLGYTQQVAENAVKNAKEDSEKFTDLGDLISHALTYTTRG
jgi:Holliday junction DNA helicase RuvA